jgi:hypothetical protein
MRPIVSLVSGALFGAGLTLSDMVDPERVLGFLNVTSGAWDPTLAFVLGGAMVPMIFAWLIAARRAKPAFAETFPAKPAPKLDPRLVGGAALFGLGWGLVGLCPGPALAAIGLGGASVWIFAAAMLTGMWMFSVLRRP